MAALMVAPVAAAGWGSYAYKYPEPDNAKYDTSDYMFQDPNNKAQDKIYFNGFAGYSLLVPPITVTSGDNPGALAEVRHMAILGYWRDCNDDGFIGNALTGQHEYPAALLVDQTICPPGSGYVNDKGDGWVTEFLHIGPGAHGATPNDQEEFYVGWDDPETFTAYVGSTAVPAYGTRTVEDNDSLVWGDLGIPDQIPTPTSAVLPLPQGTLSSWEGHVNLVDQLSFGRVPEAVDSTGVASYDDVYAVAQGLDGAGVPSPIAAVKNLYNGSTGPDEDANEDPNCGGADQPACEGAYAQPLVSVWDCRDHDGDGAIYGPTVTVDPNTPEVTTGEAYLFPPLAPHVNPDGSLDGTIFQFFRGYHATEDGCEDDPYYTNEEIFRAHMVPYRNLERSEDVGVGQDAKAEAQLTFSFLSTYYIQEIPEEDEERRQRTLPVPYTGLVDGMPYLGAGGPAMAAWYEEGAWISSHLTSLRTPAAISFFANVGSQSFDARGTTAEAALPSGDNPFFYGNFHCSSFGSDGNSTTGWNCNPAEWTTVAKVGDPFDLRDVDCIDMTMLGFTTPRPESPEEEAVSDFHDCSSDPRFQPDESEA